MTTLKNRGTGQWTIITNNQFPGFAIIMMAPALRSGIDKLRFVSQDIGGGFGNKICLHPQYVVLCLLARKLGRPVQWTEWRTDQHTAAGFLDRIDRVAVIADQKVVAVGTIPELLALDHEWIQEYFNGPRGRAAATIAEREEAGG